MKYMKERRTGMSGTSPLVFFIFFGSLDNVLECVLLAFYSVLSTLRVQRTLAVLV